MDDIQFYTELYRMLDGASPLRFDCGRLCGKACCRVEPDLPGMYLFPGEEALFAGKPGYTVAAAALPGYGPVSLLSCDSACARGERPLACRIFPLAPAVGAGSVAVRLDPRGRRVCPLCRGGVSALCADFTEAARRVFGRLAENPRSSAFTDALSRHLDEFGRPL